jgi:hypothetical protein
MLPSDGVPVPMWFNLTIGFLANNVHRPMKGSSAISSKMISCVFYVLATEVWLVRCRISFHLENVHGHKKERKLHHPMPEVVQIVFAFYEY